MKWEYSCLTSGSHHNYSGMATSLVWWIAGGEQQNILVPAYAYDQEHATANSASIFEARRDFLARLGQEGWEMVGFQGLTFYFKRPITD